MPNKAVDILFILSYINIKQDVKKRDSYNCVFNGGDASDKRTNRKSDGKNIGWRL